MIRLNLGRNCLRYIIRLYGIKEIYVPFYICKSVYHAINKEGCKIKIYHINENFLPTISFPDESYILYVNYFGMCDDNCRKMVSQYPNVIIDNTQAFYSEVKGVAGFNSLRKFFNVQNGAFLYTDEVLNQTFDEDSLSLNHKTIQQDYEQFLRNELILDNEDIKLISSKVSAVLQKIDFERDKENRLNNFWRLKNLFKDYNSISLTPKENEIPFCYPLSTKEKSIIEKLKSTKIPFLSLWGEIPSDMPEHKFLNNTVALPLDTYLPL